MKKVIFIILALGTISCAPENSDDSLSQSVNNYKNSETVITSKSSRPLNWAQKVTTSSFSNLYKVNNDVYRSEQPTTSGFTYLQQKGIVSILNLRKGHVDNVSGSTYTGNLYNVSMVSTTVSDVEIVKALRTIKNAPKPIDIHCQHGSDRTGVTMAMYRIIFQGWSKADAIDEMKNGGYNFNLQAYPNLVNYVNNVNVSFIHNQVFN